MILIIEYQKSANCKNCTNCKHCKHCNPHDKFYFSMHYIKNCKRFKADGTHVMISKHKDERQGLISLGKNLNKHTENTNSSGSD